MLTARSGWTCMASLRPPTRAQCMLSTRCVRVLPTCVASYSCTAFMCPFLVSQDSNYIDGAGVSTYPTEARLRRITPVDTSCGSPSCWTFASETVWQSSQPYLGLFPDDSGTGTLVKPPSVMLWDSRPVNGSILFMDEGRLRKWHLDGDGRATGVSTVVGAAVTSGGAYSGLDASLVVFDLPVDMAWASNGHLLVLCERYVAEVVFSDTDTVSSVTILLGSQGATSDMQDGSAPQASLVRPRWIVNVAPSTPSTSIGTFLIGGEDTVAALGSNVPARHEIGSRYSGKPRVLFDTGNGAAIYTLYPSTSGRGRSPAFPLPVSWSGVDMDMARSFDAVVPIVGSQNVGPSSIYFSYGGYDVPAANSTSDLPSPNSHQVARWTIVGGGDTWATLASAPIPMTDFSLVTVGSSVVAIGGVPAGTSQPSSAVQVFDSEAKVWSGSSYPALNTPRFAAAAGILDVNGGPALLVAGGLRYVTDSFGQLSVEHVTSVEVLALDAAGPSPASSASWVELADSLPYGRSYATPVVQSGTMFLVGGDRECPDTLLGCVGATGTALDRLTISLSDGVQVASLPAMSQKRLMPMAVFSDGRITVAGGFAFTATGTRAVVNAGAASFDPNSQLWTLGEVDPISTVSAKLGGNSNILRTCGGLLFQQLHGLSERVEKGAAGVQGWLSTMQRPDPHLGTSARCVVLNSNLYALGDAQGLPWLQDGASVDTSWLAVYSPASVPTIVINSVAQGGTSTAGGFIVTIELNTRYGATLDTSAPPSISIQGASPCSDTAYTSSPAQPPAVGDIGVYIITCVAPPGVGSGLPVEATFASGLSAAGAGSAATLSYGAPVVTQVQPAQGPALGGTTVRLVGNNFPTSLSDFNKFPVTVSIAGAACGSVAFVAPGEVSCVTPAGIGASLTVLVNVGPLSGQPGDQASNGGLWSYTKHTISRVESSSSTVDAAGGASVTIAGANFGTFDSKPAAKVGGVDCTSTMWVSDTQVTCRVPAGVGAALAVSVAIAGRTASLAGALSYSPPTVLTVVPSFNGDLTGGQVLIVQGLHFGTADTGPTATIGGVPAPSVSWISDSQLKVTTPPGVGADLPVVVNVGGQSTPATGQGKFAYASPTVQSITPAFGFVGPSFSGNFTVLGRDFGNTAADVTGVTIGGVQCPAYTRVSSTRVDCTQVPGDFDASDRSVEVIVGNQVSQSNNLFSPIEAPVVEEVQPSDALAGDEVQLTGSNFGRVAAHLLSISLGTFPCAATRYVSASRVVCTVPSSTGGVNLDVSVETAGGLSGTLSSAFSYSDIGLVPTTPTAVTGDRPSGSDTVVLQWQSEVDYTTTTPESAFLVLFSYVEGAVDTVTVDELRRLSDLFRQVPSAGVETIATGHSNVTLMRFSLASTAATVLDNSTSVVVTEYSRGLTGFDEAPVYLRVLGQNPVGLGNISSTSEPVPEKCAEFEYLSTTKPVAEWRCETCPTGAYCGGGSAEDIIPLAGYFLLPAGFGSGSAEFELVECVEPSACLGYDADSNTNVTQLRSASGSERCAAGYDGNLCHRCEVGYARSGEAACGRCRSKVANVFVLISGFAVLLVACGAVIAITLSAQGRPGRMDVQLAKITISHLTQVSLAVSFSLQWPNAARTFFEVMDTATSVDSSLISPDCVLERDEVQDSYLGSTYLARSVVTLLLPFILVPFLGLVWLVVAASVSTCKRAGVLSGKKPDTTTAPQVLDSPATEVTATLEPGANPTPLKPETKKKASEYKWWAGNYLQNFGVSVMVLLFLAHVTLTRVSMALLTCTQVGSSKAKFMIEDLSVECDTQSSAPFQYGFGLCGFLIYGLGIPAIGFTALYLHRKSLSKLATRRQFGFLYAGYKAHWYYWEAIVSLRKVCISFAAIFMSQFGVYTQTLVAQVVLVMAAVLHARARPYTRVLLNNVEAMSIGVSLVTFIGGLYLFSADDVGTGVRTVMTLIIVGSNTVFLAVAVYFMLATALGWHKVTWVGGVVIGQDGKLHRTDSLGSPADKKRPRGVLASVRNLFMGLNSSMMGYGSPARSPRSGPGKPSLELAGREGSAFMHDQGRRVRMHAADAAGSDAEEEEDVKLGMVEASAEGEAAIAAATQSLRRASSSSLDEESMGAVAPSRQGAYFVGAPPSEPGVEAESVTFGMQAWHGAGAAGQGATEMSLASPDLPGSALGAESPEREPTMSSRSSSLPSAKPGAIRGPDGLTDDTVSASSAGEGKDGDEGGKVGEDEDKAERPAPLRNAAHGGRPDSSHLAEDHHTHAWED